MSGEMLFFLSLVFVFGFLCYAVVITALGDSVTKGCFKCHRRAHSCDEVYCWECGEELRDTTTKEKCRCGRTLENHERNCIKCGAPRQTKPFVEMGLCM